MSPAPSLFALGAAPFRRLGPRLLVAIVLATSLLALLATALELYIDYRWDVDVIDEEFQRIEQTRAPAMADSLWSLDKRQIQLQLEGLLRLRDVEFGRVDGKLGERFVAGHEGAASLRVRAFPLRSPTGDAIGTLTVGMGLKGVYQRLGDRAIVIFVTQATQALLIALFVLWIVRRWITRHLAHMAEHARSLSLATLSQPLVLRRRTGSSSDELDAVVIALNRMASGLAREFEARSQAEAALRRHRDELETQVNQRTAELREAKEKAEAASQAKSTFLSHMSHELRTPLNAVLGYAQLLRLDAAPGSSQAQGLEAIRSGGQHLLDLIEQLLDLSRIEAGRLELDPSPVSLRALLQSVDAQIRLRAEAKGLRFELRVEGDVPDAFVVDEVRLRQVLLNLLGNAVKFTDHGEVRLRVARHPPAPGAAPAPLLRFEVHDSGIGIAPQELERLFQPFEQGADRQRRRAGTGLGLSISREIIRLMGSDITVLSHPQQGSVFSFGAGAAA